VENAERKTGGPTRFDNVKGIASITLLQNSLACLEPEHGNQRQKPATETDPAVEITERERMHKTQNKAGTADVC
jgi:hypothetical protein